MGGHVSFHVNRKLGRLTNDDLLQYACESGNITQFRHHLQEANLMADGFVKISELCTYLHYLVRYRSRLGRSFCRMLLTNEDLDLINKCLDNASDDTDLNIKDKEGMTVFHLCCKAFTMSPEELVDPLCNTLDNFLSHGCNINSQNIHGDTCLHTLFTRPMCCTTMDVHFLLTRGADMSILNNKGQSALYALYKFIDIGHLRKGVEAVDLELLKAGSNPNQMSEAVVVPMELVISKLVYLVTIMTLYPCSIGESFDIIMCLFLNHMRAGLNLKNIHTDQLRYFVRLLWPKANFNYSEKRIELMWQCLTELFDHGFSELVYSERLMSKKADIFQERITERFLTLQELSVYVIRVNLKPNAFVGMQLLQVPAAIKEVMGLVESNTLTLDCDKA